MIIGTFRPSGQLMYTPVFLLVLQNYPMCPTNTGTSSLTPSLYNYCSKSNVENNAIPFRILVKPINFLDPATNIPKIHCSGRRQLLRMMINKWPTMHSYDSTLSHLCNNQQLNTSAPGKNTSSHPQNIQLPSA